MYAARTASTMRLVESHTQLPVYSAMPRVATASMPRPMRICRRRALARERPACASAFTARTAANLAVDRAKFSVVLIGASRRDVTSDGMRSAAQTPASKMKRTISMILPPLVGEGMPLDARLQVFSKREKRH